MMDSAMSAAIPQYLIRQVRGLILNWTVLQAQETTTRQPGNCQQLLKGYCKKKR